ncbi:MAG: c-type cytochrome [Desulforhopalus sp.]
MESKKSVKMTATALVLIFLGFTGYMIMKNPEQKIDDPLWTVTDGNHQQGAESIIEYGCFSCHVINGIRRANGRVGPKLQDIKEQIYIGGVLANSPENMVEWIMNPLNFSAETAMPDLDVSDQDARDISAYLYRKS